MARKIEGGQGGKKGHSNMSHYEHTEVIKTYTKKLRRAEDKTAAQLEPYIPLPACVVAQSEEETGDRCENCGCYTDSIMQSERNPNKQICESCLSEEDID